LNNPPSTQSFLDFTTQHSFKMKTFIAILALFAGSSLAASVCPAGLLNATPQCCTTDVVDVAELECDVRKFCPSYFAASE
jgi:hypothetical protein